MQQFPSLLATTNTRKIQEWNAILHDIDPSLFVNPLSQKMELLEIQSFDPTDVCVTKALDARRRCGHSVLVEDMAFMLHAFAPFPGTLYASVEKMLRLKGILRLMQDAENRNVTVVQSIAFAVGDKPIVRVVQAIMSGRMSAEIWGSNGFGFDPIFIPDGHDKTLAEMDAEEKNRISMRRIAIEMLVRGEWEEVSASTSPLAIYLGY